MTKNQDAEVLRVLAAAYAARGQFSLGVAVLQKAAKLASDGQDGQMVDQICKQLELYKQEKLWRKEQVQDDRSLAGLDRE